MRTPRACPAMPFGLLGLLLLFAAALVLPSCESNPSRPFLEPTGAVGEDFTSAYFAIQVVGDFNGFDAGVPSMSEIQGGVWADTLVVQTGCYLLKFRTDNDWDETPDFGRCSGNETDCERPVPVAEGQFLQDDICAVTGSGTALGQVEFTEDGPYEFVVDERTETYRIRRLAEVGSIEGTVEFDEGRALPVATVAVVAPGGSSTITQAFSDSSDGSYRVDNVPPGTYDLLVRAPGFLEERVEGVEVVALQVTQVDPVVLGVGCQTAYTAIQLVGDFNGFDTGVPSMTEIAPCLWADTLVIDPGCYFLKFRTDNDWGTPNFERCTGVETPCEIPVPTDGSPASDCVVLGTSGGNAIGEIEILEAGRYEFLLDESALEFEVRKVIVEGGEGTLTGNVGFGDNPPLPHPTVTVRVLQQGSGNEVASGLSNAKDRFTLTNVPSGTYDVSFTAAAYEDALVGGITILAGSTTSVGTVILQPTPTGSITGSVAFSDNPPPPFPRVAITVRQGGQVVGTASSDSTTNSFAVADLESGFYDLEFVATSGSYAPVTVAGVEVVAPNASPIGTVTLPALGSISGGVAFSNSPSSNPTVTVTVFEGGTSDVVATGATNPASNAFRISGLLSGTYDVRFENPSYRDTTVAGIVVNAPSNTSMGVVTLQFTCVSGFTSFQVVGDFNGFDPGAPFMSQIGSCTWVDTLNVAAGCYRVLFRTDNDDEITPDWGRCSGTPSSCETTVPLTAGGITLDVCPVSGVSEALGELEFLFTSDYEFLLDENAGTVRIRRL